MASGPFNLLEPRDLRRLVPFASEAETFGTRSDLSDFRSSTPITCMLWMGNYISVEESSPPTSCRRAAIVNRSEGRTVKEYTPSIHHQTSNIRRYLLGAVLQGTCDKTTAKALRTTSVARRGGGSNSSEEVQFIRWGGRRHSVSFRWLEVASPASIPADPRAVMPTVEAGAW